MKLYKNTGEAKPIERVVALGVFDGVHLGHQSLLNIMRSEAKRKELVPAVYTFQAAPASLFDSRNFLGHIQTKEQRFITLTEFGAEEVFALPLSPEVLEMEPDEYLKRVILQDLRAKVIVVGRDFQFGKKAQGNSQVLARFCEKHNIDLHIAEDYFWEGTILSSTRIREQISQGNMWEAETMMKRHFSHRGEVVQGKQLGRRLGFPTLNIELESSQIAPPCGVYLSYATWGWPDNIKTAPALSNIGYRPTVENSNVLRSETFLFCEDYPKYGEKLEVAYLKFLRPEHRFTNVQELREQVNLDILEAKRLHQITNN